MVPPPIIYNRQVLYYIILQVWGPFAAIWVGFEPFGLLQGQGQGVQGGFYINTKKAIHGKRNREQPEEALRNSLAISSPTKTRLKCYTEIKNYFMYVNMYRTDPTTWSPHQLLQGACIEGWAQIKQNCTGIKIRKLVYEIYTTTIIKYYWQYLIECAIE